MTALQAPREARARSVLLVEDDDDSRELYAEGLRLAGFEVFALSGCAEALSAPLPAIDVVVLDYSMPRMTGAELALRLKEQPATSEAKFVLVSGHGPMAVRESARRTHFDAMLQKPLAPDQLARVLARILKP